MLWHVLIYTHTICFLMFTLQFRPQCFLIHWSSVLGRLPWVNTNPLLGFHLDRNSCSQNTFLPVSCLAMPCSCPQKKAVTSYYFRMGSSTYMQLPRSRFCMEQDSNVGVHWKCAGQACGASLFLHGRSHRNKGGRPQEQEVIESRVALLITVEV